MKNYQSLLEMWLKLLQEPHAFTSDLKFTNLTTQADNAIVSACSCPILKSLLSPIKDTNHALQILRDYNFSDEKLHPVISIF